MADRTDRGERRSNDDPSARRARRDVGGRDRKGRFRKGVSGNPRGRPPKFVRPPWDLVDELLGRPVPMNYMGRPEKVPVYLAAILQTMNAVLAEPSARHRTRMLKDLHAMGLFDFVKRYEADRDHHGHMEREHRERFWSKAGKLAEVAKIQLRAFEIHGYPDEEGEEEDEGGAGAGDGRGDPGTGAGESPDEPEDDGLSPEDRAELDELQRRYDELLEQHREAEAELRRFERRHGRYRSGL